MAMRSDYSPWSRARNPSPCFRVRMVNGLRRNAIRLAFQVDQLFQMTRKGEISQYFRARRDELARSALRLLMRALPGAQSRVRQTGRLDSREFISHEISFSKLKAIRVPDGHFPMRDLANLFCRRSLFRVARIAHRTL